MARCLREEGAVFEVFDLCRRISGRAVSVHYRAQIDTAMAANSKVAGFSGKLMAKVENFSEGEGPKLHKDGNIS